MMLAGGIVLTIKEEDGEDDDEARSYRKQKL
jgi:hypothetical protein